MRKSNGIVGYLDSGVKKHDIRFFDCKTIPTVKRVWRDSVAAYRTALQYCKRDADQIDPRQQLKSRTAIIIHDDRTVMEEYATRDENVSPSGKVEIYFGMTISLIGAPFWGIKKDGVMLGSSYVKEVATSANANGLVKAVKHLMSGIEIIRPDGSRMFSPHQSIRDDELRQIWAYYHKHKRMPEHGCMIPILLGEEDIRSIADTYGLMVEELPSGQYATTISHGGESHTVVTNTIYHIFVDLTVRREEV